MDRIKYKKHGFKTKEEFIDFCRHLVNKYENNTAMTINSLCTYAQEEFGVNLTYYTMRSILNKFDANMRPVGGKKYRKYKRTNFMIQLHVDDVAFIDQVFKSYGQHVRHEILNFVFSLMRGRSTKSLILWFGELRPVFFLWDPKHLKHLIFSENLSQLEKTILEELSVLVEKERNLDPVIEYAKDKHLQYWGYNEH